MSSSGFMGSGGRGYPVGTSLYECLDSRGGKAVA
jgi:hypothetical protein